MDDGNSGMGDDHCLWQLKCDPLSREASCPYDPSYAAQHTTECKPTLPADCGPVTVDAGTPPPPPVCPGTSQACGPGGIDPAACPAGTGCITGCCLNLIP